MRNISVLTFQSMPVSTLWAVPNVLGSKFILNSPDITISDMQPTMPFVYLRRGKYTESGRPPRREWGKKDYNFIKTKQKEFELCSVLYYTIYCCK